MTNTEMSTPHRVDLTHRICAGRDERKGRCAFHAPKREPISALNDHAQFPACLMGSPISRVNYEDRPECRVVGHGQLPTRRAILRLDTLVVSRHRPSATNVKPLNKTGLMLVPVKGN
jgi:hypothetical protein